MLTLRPITMVGDGLVLRFRPTPNITTVSARSLRELWCSQPSYRWQYTYTSKFASRRALAVGTGIDIVHRFYSLLASSVHVVTHSRRNVLPLYGRSKHEYWTHQYQIKLCILAQSRTFYRSGKCILCSVDGVNMLHVCRVCRVVLEMELINARCRDDCRWTYVDE